MSKLVKEARVVGLVGVVRVVGVVGVVRVVGVTGQNVMFDILEPPAFQKYSICWVF